MNYWAAYINQQLDDVTDFVRSEYTKAWSELYPVIDDYFKGFARRDAFLVEQLEKGLVPLPAGQSAEQYLKQWRLNQMGRGERWKAVQAAIEERVYFADETVKAYVNGQILTAAAASHNWRAYTIEAAATRFSLGHGASADIAFNLVNEATVARLASARAIFLPSLTTDEGRLLTWCNKKTNSELLSAVLSGERTEKLAARFQSVTSMSETAAMRNARTALTNAYNAGDQLAAEECGEMLGEELQKEWRSTLDDRTRDSHQELDGERVPIGARFSNGLEFPGDMSTNNPAETYNCRCTYITIIPGLNDSRNVTRRGRDAGGSNRLLDNMTYKGKNGTVSYEDWVQGKGKP